MHPGKRDEQVINLTLNNLIQGNADFIFVGLDDVDHAGHSAGFRLENPAYITAIEEADGYVGELSAAIKARED